MLVLVIYCHPGADSFAAALHAAVLQGLAAGGHRAVDVDLYAEAFDPVLSQQERLDYRHPQRHRPDVASHAARLANADALVLIYPAWWFGMPAMLKGYFDRVWVPGVAFDLPREGHVQTGRLQNIRRIIVVTTYGASWWMVRVVLGDPARRFVRTLRGVCAPRCRVDWYAHYNMDTASRPELTAFLSRVERRMQRLKRLAASQLQRRPAMNVEDIKGAARDTARQAQDTFNDVSQQARAQGDSMARRIADTAQDVYAQARGRSGVVADSITRQPITAVLVTGVVGCLIGLLLARR